MNLRRRGIFREYNDSSVDYAIFSFRGRPWPPDVVKSPHPPHLRRRGGGGGFRRAPSYYTCALDAAIRAPVLQTVGRRFNPRRAAFSDAYIFAAAEIFGRQECFGGFTLRARRVRICRGFDTETVSPYALFPGNIRILDLLILFLDSVGIRSVRIFRGVGYGNPKFKHRIPRKYAHSTLAYSSFSFRGNHRAYVGFRWLPVCPYMPGGSGTETQSPNTVFPGIFGF